MNMQNRAGAYMMLILILLLPAYAINMSGGIINISQANTTINISNPIYMTEMYISPDSIYFVQLKNESSSLEYLTVNITDKNRKYNVTAARNDLPHFSSSSNDKKEIATSTGTVNSDVAFTVTSCDTLYRADYESHTGVYSQSYVLPYCSSGIAYLSIVGIEQSTSSNNIILYYSTSVLNVYEKYSAGNFIVVMGSMMGAIVTVVMMGFIIAYLNGKIDIKQLYHVMLILLQLSVLFIALAILLYAILEAGA